ncbi:MAG: 50S ribosomal protein L21 [Elusimicrobia bacterium]|nr:50S ribosomal protein L21 [Elusimicrobiota bacterium]
MYAIIETGGRQFWVEPGETIHVEKLEVEPGKELTLPALWAVDDPREGRQPEPSRKAQVTVEVVGQRRGPKIIVFKKRSKKAYRKTQGHRQYYTDIRIKAIYFN